MRYRVKAPFKAQMRPGSFVDESALEPSRVDAYRRLGFIEEAPAKKPTKRAPAKTTKKTKSTKG